MKARETRIWFFVILWIFKLDGGSTVTPATTTPRPSNHCDLRPFEAVIRRLESKLEEKVNVLNNDMRTYARHIEYHTKKSQNSFTECKNDIERFMLAKVDNRTKRDGNFQATRINQNLEQKLDDISGDLQLTKAALLSVDSDLKGMKQNLLDVLNLTNTIWEKINIESSINQIFRTPTTIQNPPISPVPILPLQIIPKNCKEIKQTSPTSPSAIYLVQPDTSKPAFLVFCDMVVENGGWLTIHNRYEGNQDFYLGWDDYKVGFGNIAGEYWLGLEKIHQLTGNQMNELLVEIVDPDKFKSVALYAYFSIGSEEEGYALKVLGGYKGNAGDALSYHAGSKFSTKDKDEDSWIEGNCAQSHSGAWWYKTCDKSNLNGRYIPGQQPEQFIYQAMYWGGVTSPQIGLLQARMLIRPRDEPTAGFLPPSA